MKPTKVRVRLEMAVALCAGILGLLTIFWHDWIEAVGLLAVAVAMGFAARRHWKLLTAGPNE